MAAAKHFLRMSIEALGNAMPRVMNVDQESSIFSRYRSVESRRCPSTASCLTSVQVSEQCNRTGPPDGEETNVWLAKGYGTFQTPWRILQGIKTVHVIRKGRVRWLAKRDSVG